MACIIGCATPLGESRWKWAHEANYRKPSELKAQHEKEIKEGLLFDKLINGNPKRMTVALTFDDGPHPQYTQKILDILKTYGVKATFFVVGKMAENYPALVQAEYRAGHQLANHTYNHLNLSKIHLGEIKAELLACNYVVKSITGYDMPYFRPPGGDYNNKVIQAASEEGMTMVLWTDDPGDYTDPGKKVIEKYVLDNISNGGIILLHDGIQQTIDVLPQIIENIQKRGLKFEKIEDMDQWK